MNRVIGINRIMVSTFICLSLSTFLIGCEDSGTDSSSTGNGNSEDGNGALLKWDRSSCSNGTNLELDFSNVRFEYPANNVKFFCNTRKPKMASAPSDCNGTKLDDDSNAGVVNNKNIKFTNLKKDLYQFSIFAIGTVQGQDVPLIDPLYIDHDNACSGNSGIGSGQSKICLAETTCGGNEKSHSCSVDKETCKVTVECAKGWSETIPSGSGIETAKYGNVTCYRLAT